MTSTRLSHLSDTRKDKVIMAVTGLTCCQLCSQRFQTEEDFMNHCFTIQHRRWLFDDASSQWKYRDPPQTVKDLRLCERPQTCEYGDNCLKAHSKEEYKEWIKRLKAQRKRAQDAARRGLLSYQDGLLEEYRYSKDKEKIVSDTTDTPDVTITCDTDLKCVYLRQQGIPCMWTFTITSEEPLEVVALLRQNIGATFSLDKAPSTKLTYSTGIWFLTSKPSDDLKVYQVPVSFTSEQTGQYEQWLVFDFNTRPVLRQKLRVRVGKDRETSDVTPAPEACSSEQPEIMEPWNEESMQIVPFSHREAEEEELLNKYKLVVRPQMNKSITRTNYKESMHMFLYQEEKVEGELLARLNQRGTMQMKTILLDPQFGMRIALPGELFAVVHLSHPLTTDTQQGYIMKRHVIKALLRVVGSHAPIYEAELLKGSGAEAQVHLKISNQCCTDLNLQNEQIHEMEIQFQLNRLWLCEMHKAIDDLPDLDRVLPDLKNHSMHISHRSDTADLNDQQKAAMNFILNETDNSMPPLLIYGPFGTGKTMTLAKMAQVLVQQPQNKILICTHTNSSADLYVARHFHNFVAVHPEVRLLRIKAKEKTLKSTDQITLQYCYLSNDRHCFDFPTKAVLDSTRIIITTTAMARNLQGMRLPENYFSHILVDEASQMLECEALMALGLAGQKTRVVLAGDHMQMGPKLFSVTQDKCSEHTLLNRLFYHYQAEDSSAAKQSRIIFSENYRSTKDIVDFVSKHFYVGKIDVIKAKGNVPSHSKQHALQFHHVRGECKHDPASMSWFNEQEIQIVVDIVQEMIKNWPTNWPNPQSICVLSQGLQVYAIRQRLYQLRLSHITVENAENVQGKQFRVIVISTVHTKDSLFGTDLACLEFFNDMRVLNTIMTRAQSQIVVVGDAAALSSPHFGMCWRLWKSYIEHCINKESAHDLAEDFWKQDLLELSELCRSEDKDSSDSESITSETSDIDDRILKELLDESKDINISLTEDGLFSVLHNEQLVRNLVHGVKDSRLPQNNSSVHKCELVRNSVYHGYARSLDEPFLRINIKGRENLGHTFPGDKVEVEILDRMSDPPTGKVIQVLESADTLKEFVCTIETHDSQVMRPINKSISKIFTPFWKDKPYHIALRDPKNFTIHDFIKINEETHRNYLFVVKVLKWRKDCLFPLGIVVGVFPKIETFEDGLKVLDIEFQLKRVVPASVKREMQDLQSLPVIEPGRKDFRDLPTFTIDPADSQDLDDAVSVRDLGECYEIGVHISDVASFVHKDSELDKYARQHGTSYYCPEREPTYMFPKELSVNFFSLIPGQNRRAISLIVKVDKKTHRIKRRYFCKSIIHSKRKFSYDEVEDILKKRSKNLQDLDLCLVIACHFAEVHRTYRKQEDWCYKPPDEDVPLGRRQSHRLIEELMIMFNHAVAERLLFDKGTRSLTPLRCQERPKHTEDLFDKNASLVDLSVHLSCQADAVRLDSHTVKSQSLSVPNPEADVPETFPILMSLLQSLKTAAQDKDIYRIIDLITTDDIHPQLLPFALALRKLSQKAYFLRSNSAYASRIGHCDLDLDNYTWASSPIRRYIDVILQRLLHSVIDKTDISYKPNYINQSCVEFSRQNDHQSAYDKKVQPLHFASKLSAQNERKVAYIVEVTPLGSKFRVSFPLNRDSIPGNIDIMYRDLQLAGEPEFDQTNNCNILRWQRRVYSFSNPDIQAEFKQQKTDTVMTYVSTNTWKHLVAAIKNNNWEFMLVLIEKLGLETREHQRKVTQVQKSGADPMQGHYVELILRLKEGEVVEVQLGTDKDRGLPTPAVQLFVVNPKFEICLEHVRDPIKCFSKYTFHSSQTSYNTYMDYQKIWTPMCEMESVSNAVAENESIVLEDVPLKWETFQPEKLQGYFLLPPDKKAQWSIESDLKNCFLCIRTRFRQNQCSPFLKTSQCAGLADIQRIIWVAHGVITKAEKTSQQTKNLQIGFQVNHTSMKKVPDVIFCESTRFTVELVPKLLPDVRKENAISSLTKANQLVKAIAMGKRIKSERGCKIYQGMRTRFEINNYLPSKFCLNDSQCKAIQEALSNPFTLIQGPPGTGKTVVGVHIVYWLLKNNQQPTASQKKRAILYCGPSNKSVDVVAVHLLKLQEEVRPLRVYSDQMEMLEYPYPDSNLKLSRHSKRVETPKKALSSIALHHRIRKHDNPFSVQIKAFDMKIQRGDQLTKEEKKCYRDVLQKARKHELLQCDVILCTCTAASQSSLADALDLKQIIIDECAMATEPEAFIPLVAHKPEQVILLGDHKQLQPVVHYDVVARLGMNKSLFERYVEKALMLEVQYRMQKDICEFPSKTFYGGKLKTFKPHKPGLFQSEFQGQTSIVFGHVEGKETSLVVPTEQGNENSRANEKEAIETVRITRLLIQAGIKAHDIAILTPYNAQVGKISETLQNNAVRDVIVNTIMKSQGSEWKFVILSTVRSCPKADIEPQPTKSWITNHLGFIMDEHQVNVAITRAQEGLCIIGNENLLRCSRLWRDLLNHYQEKKCVVNPASKIQVQKPRTTRPKPYRR